MRPLERHSRSRPVSGLLPGPFATLVLADLGATVDKVEDPDLGDYLRVAPPHADGTSVVFHALNRGKRSIVLNLKSGEGAAAFARLVGSYDVVFEQFRPGVMDRLGIGHRTLLARHPKLVICALTGYGQDGPLRDKAGHDLNYLARAGLTGLMGPGRSPLATAVVSTRRRGRRLVVHRRHSSRRCETGIALETAPSSTSR